MERFLHFNQQSFVSILYASINKYKYVVYSNERSSNYGNAQYLGETVSHQWSKSQEFEDLFRSYVQKNITESVEYFSLLRPLYEIQIAKIFTLLPQYFEVFSSSNHNFKMKHDNRNRWDYTSAKTAFVFCLLAAFLPRSHMNKIFGANLFDKPELETIFKELLGVKNIKPFDCVGTPEEVKIAFYLAREHGEYANTSIMNMYEKEVLPTIHDSIESMKTEVFSFGNADNIPNQLLDILKKHV